ncbi:MAG: hypothetical protein H0W25_04895 [Acidimicrobiia bacterium]|nr:hypothetical protein [Acidimicrobiia bacterium]
MIAPLVGMTNLVLGTVYACYGVMTLVEMKRGWRTNGFSHFGAAWLCMAFTCGPHHLDHGLHVLMAGRVGGSLDLLTIAVGFPVGVAWFLLRVEALFGGRGDRTIAGTPVWLEAMPTLAASYVAVVAASITGLAFGVERLAPRAWPNVLLVLLYAAIGVLLLRTQLRTHLKSGQWSASGLSLAFVMLTCAVMHAVYVAYASAGRYDVDGHGLVIDTVGVPAAAYFLWVTWALHRGWLRDWNATSTLDAPERRPELIGAPT